MRARHRDLRLETSTALFLVSILMLPFAFPRTVAADPQKSSGDSAQPDPRALVQEMVQNEIKAENDDSTHWRFSKTNAKSGTSQTWDVIETKKGEVQHLIAIDGHPLNAQQQHAEQNRMQQFLNSPAEQAKRRQSSSKDFKKEQALMRMLPDALSYTYGGRQGDMVQLNFKPNPSFRATTREAEVFHHMAGVLIVNVKNKRLGELRGHLCSGVKFGYGILGYLDKGGTFDVKQQDIGDGHWDLTLLETNITGKALFFKTISVRQKIVEGDYHRVSDSLTLHQAANMLKTSPGRSVSAAGSSGRGSSAAGRDQ